MHREREKAVERVLLQQAIATGEQHGVEITGAREAFAHPRLVEANSNRLHYALFAQPCERRIGALHRFREARFDRVRAMRPDIHVMDEDDIDPLRAEPEQGLLEGA